MKFNPNQPIHDINRRAAELGMSYGQYVAMLYDKQRRERSETRKRQKKKEDLC